MTAITRFRLHFPSKHSIDPVSLAAVLPPTMSLSWSEEGMTLAVPTSREEDELAQQLVDRELARIFFFTLVRIRAEMHRRTVIADFTASFDVQGQLPAGPQSKPWNADLELQLRYWRNACDAVDPLVKIMLFFQVVEMAFPSTSDKAAYPAYSTPASAPHPRTEAMLLRHLVAHAGAPTSAGTKAYLQYLGLPASMNNIGSADWKSTIQSKVALVKQEAWRVLEPQLT